MVAARSEGFYNFWIVVRPSEQLEGQWVAHCLELDIVSQGNSIAHAFKMISEAVCMVIADDLEDNLDPRSRRPAPKEYWDELWSALSRGEPTDFASLNEADNASISFVAAQMVIRAASQVKEQSREVPALWSRKKSNLLSPLHA